MEKIETGDRVRDVTYGAGTVEEVDSSEQAAWVRFDNPRYADWVALEDLTRITVEP